MSSDTPGSRTFTEIANDIVEVREALYDCTGSAFLSGDKGQPGDRYAIYLKLCAANNALWGIVEELQAISSPPSETGASGVHHLDQEPADFGAAVALLRECRKDLAAAKRQACTSEHRTTCSFAPSAIESLVIKQSSVTDDGSPKHPYPQTYPLPDKRSAWLSPKVRAKIKSVSDKVMDASLLEDDLRALVIFALDDMAAPSTERAPVARLLKRHDGRVVAIAESDLEGQADHIKDLWKNATPLYDAPPSARNALERELAAERADHQHSVESSVRALKAQEAEITELLREARHKGDLGYHGGEKNVPGCAICEFVNRIDARIGAPTDGKGDVDGK